VVSIVGNTRDQSPKAKTENHRNLNAVFSWGLLRLSRVILAGADRRHISAANYLETAIVIDGSRDPIASRRVDDLIQEAQVGISGHAARLNFGDCFAYALAKTTGEPLLFKGDDFLHAGLRRAASLHSGE
jgi:uncharacterized protein with PIN domain